MKIKFLLRLVIALFFITAGVMHFLRPALFIDIVPPYLPAAKLLVYISGFFEIAGGVGLLLPRWRKTAAIGLILLLLAVFPANVFMLTDHPFILEKRIPEWVLWLRLPLQFILMTLIWWSALIKSNEEKRESRSR